MVKVLFDDKEKKFLNSRPITEIEAVKETGYIIENGEIVGLEK